MIASISGQTFAQQLPIWKNEYFAIFPDSVVQKPFTANIISANQISSNYKSPDKGNINPSISFKFSINGKDNEMAPGTDHHFTIENNLPNQATPILQFGTPLNAIRNLPDNTFLKPGTLLTIRVNMNPMLKAFEQQGFYNTYGGKIFKQDFKGLWVAGNTTPMFWDFDNLINRPELQLKDNDGDGIFETTLSMATSTHEKQIDANWTATKDVAAFPQYKSGIPISDAVYNLAMEEMVNAIEPDSTFRTGKEWAGVWTRDISYSIILSMAYLQPQVAKNSLLRKVKNGRIVQDTGTGGAYPCSTDRMIWAVAAWELYKVTGDKDWLQQAYNIIKNSVDDDMKNAYDAQTELVKGESSFLDWREQTYPKWMQPADIYESEALGTNAVHYQANKVLAQMASLLGKPNVAGLYSANAAGIKAGINQQLWLADKGYYGQFLYGRNYKIVSPRSEALGEALCVLFDIADAEKQKIILQKTPVTEYGINCIFPNIPGIPPYHNNAVWPFVETYWAMAAAKAGNETSLLKSIAAIYRPAALFATNKENFVADNGDYSGTVINSSNMLWSLSGNLAIVHKILFGIGFQADGISFAPFVPKALAGKKSLTNFKYRQAVLDIELEGFGNSIKSFLLDGKLSAPIIKDNLKGHHHIKIVMANNSPGGKINVQQNLFTPAVPLVQLENNSLTWPKVDGAISYAIIKNGKLAGTTINTKYPTSTSAQLLEYQVLATDAKGMQSFLSEPVIIPGNNTTQYEFEAVAEKSVLPYKGFTGSGFSEISTTKNTAISMPIEVLENGEYSIQIRYANGNGPINTENKCAIRTLKIQDKQIGTFVFPQRGRGEWSNWGWSNVVKVKLPKGKHVLQITFDPANANMNGAINEAMFDYLQLIRL